MNRIRRELNEAKQYLDSFNGARLILDLAYCTKLKHIMRQEYYAFDFYHKNRQARSNYVLDYEVMNVIPQRFNDPDESLILDDKSRFDEVFCDLLGRDFLRIDSHAQASFNEFLSKHCDFIVKPLDRWGGRGIQKIHHASSAVFDGLVEEYGSCLIEELFQQHEEMNRLNPDTVNTIRVITMRNKKGAVVTPFANIRIGRMGADVDNFCSGGMTASVDMEQGVVISEAIDKDLNHFSRHPDTNQPILGFQVPMWNEIKKCVTNAAERLPGMSYIGWDVVISKDGAVCLIEGNSNPEARIHQMTLKRGLRSEYFAILGTF